MYNIIKRFIDILLSILTLSILGIPLLLAFLVSCITLRSNGIFTQTRIGKDEKEFKIYKLKTMTNNNPDLGTTSLRNDPRVKRFGHFLRKFKIDELPQVLNIINGTMSVVGPRPTVREDVDRMNKWQKRRFEVKSGLTGLAQINGNTSLTWPERIEYDIQYIENRSIMLDLSIILKTFLLILNARAETHPKYDNEWEEK